MTSEATFAKLSYLIGKVLKLKLNFFFFFFFHNLFKIDVFFFFFKIKNFSQAEISKYILKNIRGELTPTPKNVFSYREETLLVKLHEAFHNSSSESIHMLEKMVLPNIILHMTQNGYLHFMKDLNDNGIDIIQNDFEGRNSFHIAARENDLNMIRYLLGISSVLL